MNTRKQQTRSAIEVEARRNFLKSIGKATATAPAVVLLLAASTKSASAQSPYCDPDPNDSDCGSA